LGIGAQKSGTTWLYYQLKEIPEFDLPPIKEFHYFDRSPTYLSPNKLSETLLIKRIKRKKYLSRTIKTIRFYIKRQNWKLSKFYFKWYLSNYSDHWYLSLFDGFEGYTGEISPGYSILEEEDIKRMYRLIPDAKLILILRNPIDRAWSHFRFMKRKAGPLAAKNVDDKTIIDFLESERQILRSNYIRIIDRYSNIFPKDQILICFYDAIVHSPDELLSEITKFISGEFSIPVSQSELTKVFNKSKEIDCPESIENYLKDKYHSQIKLLAEKYGGYFNKWYEETYGEKSTNENRELLPTMRL